MARSVLVTGAGGFLGRHLAGRLAREGWRVTALDNLSSPNSDLSCAPLLHPNVTTREGSVLDTGTIRPLVQSHEVVVHFAALVGVEATIRDPGTTARNLLGTMQVVEALTADHVSLFGSSADVYGMHSRLYDRPMKEDDLVVFESAHVGRWLYPHLKAAEENLFHNAPGTNLNIRIFNSYGPGMDYPDARRVVPRFVQQLIARQPLQLSGDGSQKRTFCYFEDTVEGCCRALSWARAQPKRTKQTFNIGQHEAISIRELAELVLEVGLDERTIDCPLPIEVNGLSYSSRFDDGWSRCPDISRANRELGYFPERSLREGLVRTLRHYQPAKLQ